LTEFVLFIHDTPELKAEFDKLLALANSQPEKVTAKDLFRFKYEGYEDVRDLQSWYAAMYLDAQEGNDYLRQSRDAAVIKKHDLLDQRAELTEDDFVKGQNAVQRLFGILSRRLKATRSRNRTVFHLKAYMEWVFNRKGRTSRNLPHENNLSEEMGRFLFAHGFFPFIRFRIGKKEPDLYAISPHEEILIEAKKYSGETKPSVSSLQTDINQAIDYYGVVKHAMQSIGIETIDNEVFLVVFYNGNHRLRIEPDGLYQSNVFISIVPVYLGGKTPSQTRPELLICLSNKS
jgi:hypothetical protein